MRNRSLALVVRNKQLLIVQTHRFGRNINELPGGEIENSETPEETALRELAEECGLIGNIVRPLNILHRKNGSIEYVFLINVSENQIAITGKDPEIAEGETQVIKNVCWMRFEELSERDQSFLWSYGLMDVAGPWNSFE